MNIISNAFSLNMISNDYIIAVKHLTRKKASHLAREGQWDSAVGHADTAAIVSDQLGVEVPCNRRTVTLGSGDRLLVGQYSGPRLEEGTSTLPEGATIKWLMVSIV